MTTPIASEPELPALVKKALRRAFSLGEVHWQQADSESYSQNKKADATQAKFAALIEETIAALSSRSGSAAETAGWRLVPVELTAQMRMAYHEANAAHEAQYPNDGKGRSGRVWSAMLSAAPQPPSTSTPDTEGEKG